MKELRYTKSSIHHLTDDPAKEYAKAVDGARTRLQLAEVMVTWSYIAYDAMVASVAIKDWEHWRKALKMERKGHYEEDHDPYIDILMPSAMFQVSWTSQAFKAPWGTAFIRMLELGALKETQAGGVKHVVYAGKEGMDARRSDNRRARRR